MKTVIGIVMKPFLQSQIKDSLWKDLYVKQDFADILLNHGATSIGIIPQGISLDRVNSNDINLSSENDLTDIEKQNLHKSFHACLYYTIHSMETVNLL